VCCICHHQAVEEAIARMEYELTHESLSADREKMVRDKKERAEKHDRPAAMHLAQVRPVSLPVHASSHAHLFCSHIPSVVTGLAVDSTTTGTQLMQMRADAAVWCYIDPCLQPDLS
jgi:hypothetical protein